MAICLPLQLHLNENMYNQERNNDFQVRIQNKFEIFTYWDVAFLMKLTIM